MNNGYMPCGAYEDSSAPFNQEDRADKVFDVKVCCFLDAIGKFESDNYDDETGEYQGTNMEAVRAFAKQNITPVMLIQEYKECLKEKLSRTTAKSERNYLNARIEACNMWQSEEIDEG